MNGSDDIRTPLWGQNALHIRDEVRRLLAPNSATEPWEPGIIARYLTVAGATVDLRQDETSRGYVDDTNCTGCGYHSGWTEIEFARADAQRHAEKCRALPRPAVTE